MNPHPTPGPGTPVLVVGAGRSGAAAAHALIDVGADVRVVDAGAGERVAAAARELDARGALVRVDVDLDRAGLLDGVELIVPSPGVPPATGVLRAAAERGVPVWSEPELAWRLSDGGTRIVGVTGTNGKTTTTELVGAVLGAPTAGNIGTPLVTALTTSPRPSIVVAELSSFQLNFTSRLRCDVGVLLNVAEDHLDWHGGRQGYAAAKARIWAGARPTGAPGLDGRDWAVVGVDDDGARDAMAAHPPGGGVLGFTVAPPREGEVGVEDGHVVAHLPGRDPEPIVAVEALALRGPHNVANVCAAAAAALAVGAGTGAGTKPGDLAGPLAGHRPGAHRLAAVGTRRGATWVDDSKATNPHAAAAALASFPSVVWIAGGLAKGVDLSSLDPLLDDHVRAVLTIGTDGPAIAARARGRGITTVEAGDLATAVRRAAGLARPGDTVLLAPACASMDQFTDYAERGDTFARLVQELPEDGPADPDGPGAEPARATDRGDRRAT